MRESESQVRHGTPFFTENFGELFKCSVPPREYMQLEKILVQSGKELVREIVEPTVRTIVQHPLQSALIATLTYPFLGLQNEDLFLASEATYFGINAVRDYVLYDAGNLVRQQKHPVLRHAIVSALAVGALSTTGLVLQHRDVFAYGWEAYSVKKMLEHTLRTGVGADLLVRLAGRLALVRERKKQKKKKDLVQRIVQGSDQVFEHPIIAGMVAGALEIPGVLEKMAGEGWQGYPLSARDYVAGAGKEYMRDALLYGLGVALVGSVMHSGSGPRLWRKYAEKPYYALREKWASGAQKQLFLRKAVGVQEKIVGDAVSLEERVGSVVQLGAILEKMGEREKALQQYKRAVRLSGRKVGKLGVHEVMRDVMGLEALFHGLQMPIKDPDDESELVRMGFMGILSRNEKEGVRLWKKVHEEHPDNRTYRFLYAKGLELTGETFAAAREKYLLAKELIEEKGMVLRAVRSKQKTILFTDKALGSQFISKENDLQSLRAERKMSAYVGSFLGDADEAYVPLPVGIIRNNNAFQYVMEFEQGKDLYEKIREGSATFDDFSRVMDVAARVHVKVDSKRVREKEWVHQRVVGERLQQNGLEASFVHDVMWALGPSVRDMQDVPLVYNKDCNPENFRFDDWGGLCVLDCEKGRMTPVALEWANLFDYAKAKGGRDVLSGDEKDALLHAYIRRFQKTARDKVMSDFKVVKRAYLNAVPLRALTLYASLRDRKRNDVVFSLLENSMSAIDQLRNEFPLYAQGHAAEYKVLEMRLEDLRAREVTRMSGAVR